MQKKALPTKVKIVIIGGGVIGTSVAYHLAERGCTDILLLDKGELGHGSSHRAAGTISKLGLTASGVEIMKHAWRTYENFKKEGDIDLHPNPYILPLWQNNPGYYQQYLKEVVNILKSLGSTAKVEALSAEKTKNIVPEIRLNDVEPGLGNVLGAVMDWESVWVDPYLLVMAYAKRARKLGVDIRTRIEVTGIIVKGGKVKGVETTAGQVECDKIVCSAGPWASKIGKMVGLEIPVKPVRRVLIKIQKKEETKDKWGQYQDEPGSHEKRKGLWIRHDVAGFVGSGTHEIEGKDEAVDPDNYNESYTYEEVIDFATKLDQQMPGFGEFDVVDGWAGLYEVTHDSNWIMDKAESPEGFYLICGFSGEGIHASAAAGLFASELILDGKVKCVKDPSLWAYNSQRFPEIL